MLKGDAPASTISASAGRRASSRAILLGVSLAWLVVCSALGLSQSLRPDPFVAPAFMTLDWWRYPVERHAPLRLPLIGGELRGLQVSADGLHIWVVGDRGLVLVSEDGGTTWQRRALESPASAGVPPPPVPAKASAFRLISDAQAALPAEKGYDPKLQSVRPADNAFDPRTQTARPAVSNAAAQKTDTPQPANGITAPVNAPALDGSIDLLGESLGSPASPNAAQKQAPNRVTPPKDAPAQDTAATQTPAQQTVPDKAAPPPPAPAADLYAVSFDEAGRIGLIGDAQGVLHGTRDGGESWQVVTRFEGAVLAVAILQDGRQLVVSRRGTLYQFDATTGSWRVRADLGPLADAAIDAASGRVLVVTAAGGLADSSDGGATWRESAAPLQGRGRVLQLTARSEIWGGGRGVWMTHAGDTPLTLGAPVGVPVPDVLLHAVRRGADAEYAAGEQGSIFKRRNAFEPWRPVSSGRAGALRDVRLAAGGAGTAIGPGAIPFVTRDGGQTWTPLGAQHQRFPAPWLWLAWLIGLTGLVAAALRRPPPQSAGVTETAADAFVSDKPLAAVREDRLDFAPLAWGLSAFLRNEKTDAPLTIAITGDWGSGKSSLMGLLKEDLARFGVRSVWFNAWHHQKEEALLAALLTSIRDQAIPGWFTFEGFEYRIRLLWTRGRRYWPLSLAVAFSIGLFGWALTHPGTVLDNWFTLADDLWSAFSDDKSKPDPDSLMARLRATGLAAGALAPVIGALLRMRAFGVDPAALAASISSRASVKDLGSQASFRQKFAEQFSEVTEALEPRTMLVLIDDLDRCKPEAVLEVMEAVNFLVSSGRVYVVLGMARARVEACVGLAFEKVAHELVEAESAKAVIELPGEDKDARARRIRREYAQQYLEKLINIEVPVPKLDPQRSAHLQDEEGGERLALELPATLRRVCRLWPALVGALAIFAGAWLGSHLPVAVQRKPVPVVQTTQGPAVGAVPEVVAQPGTAQPEVASQEAVYFIPAETTGTAPWLPVVLLVMVGTIVSLALVRRPSPVVRDSDAFRKALEIWNPVVATALRTPRAVKRYQNRVRYMAMMARNTRRALTLRDELRMWLLRRKDPGGAAPVGDPSPELVAIGALDKALPGWEKSASLKDAVSALEQADLRDALAAALSAHQQRFSLEAVVRFVPQFRRIASGVRIEGAAVEGLRAVPSGSAA
ncbi:hypothetical protein GCM10025771_03090 [Niveibacterium umoris]|uniref:Photosystem II stability/assembly factor-like uncharacterized protein n=1 Tax=Niveibacterium umoris TaxID=1193620 RepID=A0A840BRT0_9RHOO|nr:P-loop NTPase fold protein [Niveibacterium umoris]MBB4014149.1 photosystem II stability/assembly factor-like uncharacterized protein [Niveibacterium umoris]